MHQPSLKSRAQKLTSCLLAGLAAGIVLVPGNAHAAAPSNDNFADRTAVTLPFTDSQDTTNATEEVGEPQPDCGYGVGKTVWYEYVPTSSGMVQVDTVGSDFDTVLAIWTGDSLTTLTNVACDDDGAVEPGSMAIFPVTASTPYLIQVGGYDGEAGGLSLRVGPPTSGSISGRVTSDTGEPLADICVEALSESDHWGGWAKTNSAGAYTIGGLSDGTHNVRFYDRCDNQRSHESEWFDNEPTLATATDVVVTSPEAVTGIDAELNSLVLGSISGTVTSDSDEPLPDICVYVYDPEEDDTVGRAATGVGGTYSIGVPTGTYKVYFYDGCDERWNHEPEWFENQPTYSTANDVTVAGPDATIGIDAELTELGSISGTVTSDTGEPVSPVCVDVYDAETGRWAAWTETTASGSYVVGVLDGTYHVTFYDCEGVSNYEREWFDDQPTRATATEVIVNGANETAGIDAELTTRVVGSISGTVTSESGEPLPNICVNAYDAATRDWSGGDLTDSSGTYTATLPEGVYHVEFRVCYGQHGYASEWFEDQPTEDTANEVVVTRDTAVGVIDAELTSLGAITGTVTSEDTGEPLSDVCVQVYEAATGGVAGAGRTDSSGSYITYVPNGTYSLLFYDCWGTMEYLQEWFDNQPNRAAANEVVVSGSNVTSEIDAALAPFGSDPGAVETLITAGPSGFASSSSTSFSFVASEPGSTFECSLDGSGFSPCTSPASFSELMEGQRRFRVRAIGPEGQVDPSPAERTWVVDTSAPVLSIQRPTAGMYVNDQSVGGTGPIVVVGSVRVQATAIDPQSGVSSFQFEVDGIPLDPTAMTRQGDTYRFTYIPVTAGEHTISLRAGNGAGLQSSMTIDVIGVPAG